MNEINRIDFNNYVFIDIHGFRHRERFICKEFCLIDGDYQFHALVKSPYSFEKLNEFYQRHALLQTKFHGLTFDCGDIHPIDLKQAVFPKLMNKQIIIFFENLMVKIYVPMFWPT